MHDLERQTAPAGDEDQVTVESRVASGCCVRVDSSRAPVHVLSSLTHSSSSNSKPRASLSVCAHAPSKKSLLLDLINHEQNLNLI